jgi:hypothetical protein
MQKWMITYSLLLGFLSLYISSHAAPVKKTAGYNSSFTPVIKQTFPLSGENRNDGQCDYYSINFNSRAAVSLTQFFLLAERYVSFSHCAVFKDIMIEIDKKRIINDHLLHLYPFHFFW